MEDYYQVLGVSQDATQEEIKERFKFLAHAYHPDKFSNPKHKKEAEEIFKKANEAYQILSDPVMRSRYDKQRNSSVPADHDKHRYDQTARHVHPSDSHSRPEPPPHPPRETQANFDEDLGSGIKMKLLWIKPGTFQMGSPISEAGRSNNEGPVHAVTLDGFWMSETPVTQAQYMTIIGTNPSKFKSANALKNLSFNPLEMVKGIIGPYPSKFKSANKPVETVSWYDAVKFCEEISRKTGRNYALPTEAQWEYACRAGSMSKYCFGDSESDLGDYAWYGDEDIHGLFVYGTHPVRLKKPNSWGLYEMHGNVGNWCADYFAAD